MNKITTENGRLATFPARLLCLVVVVSVLQLASRGWGQDSIVQITAESQGLTQVPPDQLPPFGTFWLVSPGGPNGCMNLPLPTPPIGNFPTFQAADGQFIVDGTVGETVSQQTLEAQASSVVNLINQIQSTQVSQLASATRMSAMASSGVPLPGGDGGSGYSDNGLTNYPTLTYNTNLLWLQISNVFNGTAYASLHNATNQVYAIWSTPDLTIPFAYWEVETEVFPTPATTNLLPFLVSTLGRQDLFLRAQDWTDVYSNGLPCWWTWLYFGNLSESAADLDSSGVNTLGYDYTNGINPNPINFSDVEVPNVYVNSSLAAAQLDVTGNPYYLAILVDDDNFADAVWNPYVSSNIVVNLGTTEGWHGVWIGLRGHADDASVATWKWIRLKLSFTPPVLVITNPVNGVVTVPLTQLMGYSTEPLASIDYDLSNGTGTVTNQTVMITGQTYDTNAADFVTNYFQAYDLPLANGTNAITLHATDFAGNVTTISTNLIYVADTNPPVVSLIWPQDGMQISATNFTIQGQVNDPTATVSAMLVDASGNTNLYNGLTGRDGNFWVQNVSLTAGASVVSLTITDGSGSATTNFTIIQSNVPLSINPVSAGDTLVGGTIGVTGYTIWANGVQATQTNGSWTAQITPIGVGGGVVNVMAVPDGSASYSIAQASASSASAGSNSSPSANTQATVQSPQGVFTSVSERNYEDDYSWYTYGSLFKAYNINDYQDGQPGSYTTFYLYTGYTTELYTANWGGANWPQMPSGPSTDISGYVQEVTGTNWDPLYFATTNAGVGGPEIIGSAHRNTKQINMVSPGVPLCTSKKIDDDELKLATGGPLGSKQQNFWILTASASDIDTGEQIPYDQITVGGFGSPDTNGELYVALPDNDPDTVTVHASGHKNYAFSVGATKYTAVSQVATLALSDQNFGRTKLGVGEQVILYFSPDLKKNADWKTSAGGLLHTKYTSNSFIAPSNANPNVVVTATINGQTAQFHPFNVVEPSGYKGRIISTNHYSPGLMGGGMTDQVYVLPTDVSFYRIAMTELPAHPINITGYFTNQSFNVSVGSANVQSDNSYNDLVAMGAIRPPLPIYPGSLEIDVTNYWGMQGTTPTNFFKVIPSYANVLNSSGDFSVNKYGITLTRSTNDVSHSSQ